MPAPLSLVILTPTKYTVGLRSSISNLVDTLIVVGVLKFIVLNKEQASLSKIQLYRSKVSSLMYLVVQTRLDIVFTTLVLS